MRTDFSHRQLEDPELARADRILRACVHCGFCAATCPTHGLSGDERESPRGRIYLIKGLLESGRGGPAVIRHLDSCLGCLACVTTCPADVDYMHLADLARRRIEDGGGRRLGARLWRRTLAGVLVHPRLLRPALGLARLLRPLAWAMPGRLGEMVAEAARLPIRRAGLPGPGRFAAAGPRRRRVALLEGCVQSVVGAAINDATIRFLTRHGCEVVIAVGAGCCGGLARQIGDGRGERAAARRNIAAWSALLNDDRLDAVVINASGCGPMVRDYGDLLSDEPRWAARAARLSALVREISEFADGLVLAPLASFRRPVVAYHSPCSLRHGQGVTDQPPALLRRAGFDVRELRGDPSCCGGAGLYGLLNPAPAARLGALSRARLKALEPEVIATGNIGCLAQIASPGAPPVVHVIELLDWATGGPPPPALSGAG